MAGTGKAHLRDGDNVLRVEDLVVEFKTGHNVTVKAVSGISFDVRRGETLGIVGESGCGKSTTGRAIMQIPKPTSGSIVFEGQRTHDDVPEGAPRSADQGADDLPGSDLVAQPAPHASARACSNRSTSGNAARRRNGERSSTRSSNRSESTPQRAAESRPHQFSGGQCQRISVARALVLDPTLIICDEPVSALDVSVQAQVLNLLEDLKVKYGLTLMFIAHDLAVVKNISDRVAVMYLGKLCEVAPSDDLYARPAHPYTNVLLQSIPEPDPDADHSVADLVGELPSPVNPPSGCRFHTRCPNADGLCVTDEPQLRSMGDGHFVACHHPVETAVTISASPTSVTTLA